MLPAPTLSKKPEPDPFRPSPLAAQQRRLPDAAFAPLRAPTLQEQALKKAAVMMWEEEEEEEEQDEAAKAFLANSIAPSLSQLELRTLLKVRVACVGRAPDADMQKFNVSPSGLKVELAQRLEHAVKTKAIPMEAVVRSAVHSPNAR